MKIRKRYKLALAVIGFMMFGPGVLTILALMKYIDRFEGTPEALAQGAPESAA